MSHFTVLVITDKTQIVGTDYEDEAERLLNPFSEHHEDGEGRWDWWVIGGRWEGDLAGGYEPSDDIRNYSTCRLCNGTNIRADEVGVENGMVESKRCNGCWEPDAEKAETKTLSDGSKMFGMSRNFDNVPTDKNVMLVRDIRDDFRPFAYVLDGEWIESATMGMWATTTNENDEYPAQVKAALAEHADRVAVLVDCHQ